jgi:2'-5' RNA ligase
VDPKNMHLTLKFIGEIDEKKLGDIEGRLREIKFKKFECLINGVGVFPNEDYIKVVWTGVHGVDELAGQVIDALRGYGKEEKFHGHATIARVKRKLDIKSFLQKHDEEIGRFTVSRFELIQSVLEKEGPQYSTLATFEAEEDA